MRPLAVVEAEVPRQSHPQQDQWCKGRIVILYHKRTYILNSGLYETPRPQGKKRRRLASCVLSRGQINWAQTERELPVIAIVDYKAGNLTSVLRAVTHLGHAAEITDDAKKIRAAERVIFPGVCAAGETMANLKRLGLDAVLKDSVYRAGKPLLGICIGAQVIIEHSEENETECLGLLPGKAQRFSSDSGLKIPQIGWNAVRQVARHPIFEGVPDAAEFYFVNSYYPVPADRSLVLAETNYGVRFASVLGRGNLMATQFHLEKSGKVGLRMLDNFCTWDGRVIC